MSDVTTSRHGSPAAIANLALESDWSGLCHNLHELELHYLDDGCEKFRGRVLDTRFGELTIRRVASEGGSHCAIRSRSMMTGHEVETMWVCLVLRGQLQLEHADQIAELQTGDLSIVDYTRDYAVRAIPPAVDTLWLGAPRPLMEHYIHDVDEFVGMRTDGSKGPELLTHRVIAAAFADPEPMSGAAANRIVHGIFGMLGASFDSERLQDSGSNYRARIKRRIKRHIEQHLDDDNLSIACIARQQGVSTRYLAKLFESEPQTISRWIWERRLERCRHALQEAAPSTTVAEIAYAHGFKNLSHFSRVFKARYGHTPSATLTRKG